MPRTRRLTLAAPALLLVLLVVGGSGGCGQHPAEDDQDPDRYHLDPPGLADLEAGEVGPGVPVLCYHYFRGGFDPGYIMKVLGSVLFGMPALGPREFWTTPVQQLEKQLEYFAETGTVVMTLDEVADAVLSGDDLPPRAVVLTIDDADRSVYEHAFPLLRKHGVRAHLFVPTAKVGGHWSSLNLCSWQQLKEMADSGTIILGSHTRDLHFKIRTGGKQDPVFWHPELIPGETRAETAAHLDQLLEEHPEFGISEPARQALTGEFGPVAADLLASRLDIAAATGHRARWLAWPYGFADGDLDSLSRVVGFRGTLSLRPATFSRQDTLLQVGRFTLTAKSTLERISHVFPAEPHP